MSWYEAFAFCAWSGGRLPTLTEWNYASAGGDEQRVYPWSTPPSSTDIGNVRAVYAFNASTSPGNTPFLEVNAKPAGAGRWGHYNLAGNLAEWVLDQEGDPPLPCNDCALLDVGGVRLTAGGGWADNTENVLASAHLGSTPSNRSILVGFRCAFDE